MGRSGAGRVIIPPQTKSGGAATAKRPGTIQSIAIAARFLDILAKADGPLALGEIARRTRTGSSTAHRYLQSLVREGLAAQDEVTGHYDLGPVALSIGVRALRRIDAVEVAARAMKTLAGSIAASCGVAIWTERGPTIVRWYRSTDFALSTVTLGDVLPLDNTASGLVFQAHMPKEAVAAARKLQPSSFRGERPTPRRLEEVRREEGAELNEHLFSLLTGKAAPVFNALGEIACVVTTVSFVQAAEADGHRAALFSAARAATLDSGGT